MNKYVSSRKPVLLADKQKDKLEDLKVPEQLQNIVAHIEDLIEINKLVKHSELASFYMVPQQGSDMPTEY